MPSIPSSRSVLDLEDENNPSIDYSQKSLRRGNLGFYD
jgi:hypothetical protein